MTDSVVHLDSEAKKNLEKRVRISQPKQGFSLATVTEERSRYVRNSAMLLARAFDNSKLISSFDTMFAPRWELEFGNQDNAHNVNTRAAWNLICIWLLARSSGEVGSHAGFHEAEDWFVSGSVMPAPRLSSAILPDAQNQALEELSNVSLDPDFWELFPYILEEHGPGSRASVLRDPTTGNARIIKKRHGVFYSPTDVADFMVDRAMLNYAGDASDAKCLDPTSGTGVFLLSLCRAAETRAQTGVSFDRFAYTIDHLFGCDISAHAIEGCAFVLLNHCLSDIDKHGVSPWVAWHVIRLNLADIDSLTLASVQTALTPNRSFGQTSREGQRRSLLQSKISWVEPTKETFKVSRSQRYSHLLLDDHRMLHVGELFSEATDGFELIITNPPYIALGKRSDYDLLASEYRCLSEGRPSSEENTFLLFVEMMWRLATPGLNSSAMVTPLSVAYNGGTQYKNCRRAMSQQGGHWKFAFFDREPHALFGEEVKTRNAILFRFEDISTPPIGETAIIETGPLRKWTSRTRKDLFDSIRFTSLGASDITHGVPKIQGPLQAEAFTRLSHNPKTDKYFIKKAGTCPLEHAIGKRRVNKVYVGGTAYNFLNVFRSFIPDDKSDLPFSESPIHYLEFDSEVQANAAFAILSSRLVFWFWHTQGDGFHVSGWFIRNIPFLYMDFTSDELRDLAKLGERLWKKVQSHRFRSVNRGKRTYGFRPLAFNEERDAIDSILVRASKLPNTFVRELNEFVRTTVVVDNSDARRQHLQNYFIEGD